MNGHKTGWLAQGRRSVPGRLSVRLFGFWSRLFAVICPLDLATGRYVDDRPLTGEETGTARVMLLGSWGISPL
jgi:hypothetical protein